MKTVLVLLVIIIAGFFISNLLVTKEEITFSKISFGDKTWNIEVAESLNDRAKGLSGREKLNPETGMLFVFSKDDLHGIWMKEMNFNIDIIWLDQNFKVVGLKEMAMPESFPKAFYPEAPSRYVLEIGAGEAIDAGLKIGSLLKIF